MEKNAFALAALPSMISAARIGVPVAARAFAPKIGNFGRIVKGLFSKKPIQAGSFRKPSSATASQTGVVPYKAPSTSSGINNSIGYVQPKTTVNQTMSIGYSQPRVNTPAVINTPQAVKKKFPAKGFAMGAAVAGTAAASGAIGYNAGINKVASMYKEAFWGAAAKAVSSFAGKASARIKPIATGAINAAKANPIATGVVIGAGGLGVGVGSMMNKSASLSATEIIQPFYNRLVSTKIEPEMQKVAVSVMGAARTYAADIKRAASLAGENPHAIKNTAGLMRVNTGQKAAEAVKRSNEMKQMAKIMGSGKLSDKAMADAAKNHRIGQRRLGVKQWMDQQSDDRLYSIAKKMN